MDFAKNTQLNTKSLNIITSISFSSQVMLPTY